MDTGVISRLGLLSAAAALLVAFVTWRSDGGALFSPGGLNAVAGAPLGGVTSHAALSARCGACHTSPWSSVSMDELCLRCHTDVQAQLADTATLHGALRAAARCRACHTEHRGPAGALTDFVDPAVHEQLGFSLAAHRTTRSGTAFDCADCHDRTDHAVAADRCRSCHEEDRPDWLAAHVADWGSDCIACHDGVDRFTPFDHSRTPLPLTGGHADIVCTECHARARTAADFTRGTQTCVSCHRDDDEHRGEFGDDCAACHSSSTWRDARFDHEFPLTHGIRRGSATACRVCHDDAPRSYDGYTCYGCHEHSEAGVRREHLDEGLRDYADCMRCHPTGREDEAERDGRRRRR